jgi:hypothetical protein
MDNLEKRLPLKQKLFHEFREYLINVIYLTLFFSAVIFYRRLVLAQHGIVVEDYFLGIVKALVIGKVIMIGAFLRISRKYENKPLIIPTLYKSFLFTLWVMIFDMIEIYIKAFIQTPGFTEAFQGLKHHINPAWFGAAVVICISFLPFFAMKELSRVMGKDKFRGLFFKSRA